jgi:hypothetical protein
VAVSGLGLGSDGWLMLTTSNEARARPTPCRRFESRNDGIGLKNATTPHQKPANPIAKIKLPMVAPQPVVCIELRLQH